ncbi:MAG: DUF3806 domain-containing protein [Marinagarivorans sp.]|nr:DUF3806 domain-containing protein [Marinagarivorans sp.]
MKAFITLVLLLSLLATTAHAADNTEVKLSEINWIDKKYFDKQRAQIDELGRSQFGTRLRGSTADLELLQRIIDNELINTTDVNDHKALGVVLGDIYVVDKGWEWKEYQDKEGKSRGVCAPKTEQCVFPISMMTRRLKVTTKINIERIYQRGLDFMAESLPKLPYSAPVPQEKTPETRDRNTIVVPFR